jgi:hypothetical protein
MKKVEESIEKEVRENNARLKKLEDIAGRKESESEVRKNDNNLETVMREICRK